MADIKDFVKKQAGGALKIGTPHPKTEEAEVVAAPVEEKAAEVVVEAPAVVVEPEQPAAVQEEEVPQAVPSVVEKKATPKTQKTDKTVLRTGKVGRPKLAEDRVKMSIYVTPETKERLNMLKFTNYEPSVNDIIIKAIDEYIENHKKF